MLDDHAKSKLKQTASERQYEQIPQQILEPHIMEKSFEFEVEGIASQEHVQDGASFGAGLQEPINRDVSVSLESKVKRRNNVICSDGENIAMLQEAIAEAKVLLNVQLAKLVVPPENSTEGCPTTCGRVQHPVYWRCYLFLRCVPKRSGVCAPNVTCWNVKEPLNWAFGGVCSGLSGNRRLSEVVGVLCGRNQVVTEGAFMISVANQRMGTQTLEKRIRLLGRGVDAERRRFKEEREQTMNATRPKRTSARLPPK